MVIGRVIRAICALTLIALLMACSTVSPLPHSQPPSIVYEYPEKLGISEPAADEVIIVVNDNIKMVHAGLFAGDTLLDPAGSYLITRKQQTGWSGTSLQDYLRFQLEDGPKVMVYRFHLPPESFAEIKSRIDLSGRTMPLFCAAKVQDVISGVPPFESIPSAWLVTPAAVSSHLDLLIKNDVHVGGCYWPDGSSCYPVQ